jgi:hypothetical protein
VPLLAGPAVSLFGILPCCIRFENGPNSEAIESKARSQEEHCWASQQWHPKRFTSIGRSLEQIGVSATTAQLPFHPRLESLVLSERRPRLDISRLYVAGSLLRPSEAKNQMPRRTAFTSSRIGQTVVPRVSLPERVARFQARKQASGRKDLPQRTRRCAEGRQRSHTRSKRKRSKVRRRSGLRAREVWIMCEHVSCAGKIQKKFGGGCDSMISRSMNIRDGRTLAGSGLSWARRRPFQDL